VRPLAILVDIDGTLITTGGAGATALMCLRQVLAG
jgi:hypothetical protein